MDTETRILLKELEIMLESEHITLSAMIKNVKDVNLRKQYWIRLNHIALVIPKAKAKLAEPDQTITEIKCHAAEYREVSDYLDSKGVVKGSLSLIGRIKAYEDKLADPEQFTKVGFSRDMLQKWIQALEFGGSYSTPAILEMKSFLDLDAKYSVLPKRELAHDRDIHNCWGKITPARDNYAHGFWDGWRNAEKHHGIINKT